MTTQGIRSPSEKLKMMDFTVSVADTGDQAVEIFSRSPNYFDLVVLDLLMPDMNGSEIHELLKIQNPDVRILFTSGVFDIDYLRGVLRYGNNGFVIKPFNYGQLQRAIYKILNHTF